MHQNYDFQIGSFWHFWRIFLEETELIKWANEL